MATEREYQPEKKGDWRVAATFWGGVAVAVTAGSAVVAGAGVLLMGIGAYSWFKNRGK